MQRYFYPDNSGVANPLLSESLFTDPSQLRVSRANLSDAGQYGYAGPSPSTSQNYGPGWNGDTWSNNYQFSNHPAMDAAQRAAASQSGGQRGSVGGRSAYAPLTDSAPENAILGGVQNATQLGLQLRRQTDAAMGQDINQGKSRYEVFAAQPQLRDALEPTRMAMYEAVHGHSPDEEEKQRITRQAAAMAMRLKLGDFEQQQQKLKFDQHRQFSHELGYNLEDAYRAFQALPMNSQREGAVIELPSKVANDGVTPIPGRKLAIDRRTLRMLQSVHDELFGERHSPYEPLMGGDVVDQRQADASQYAGFRKQQDSIAAKERAERDTLRAQRAAEQAAQRSSAFYSNFGD